MKNLTTDLVSISREWYYNQKFVQYELVNQLRFKYLSLRRKNQAGKLIIQRYLFGYSIDLLNKVFEKYKILTDDSVLLYGDLAVWNNDMPMFSYENEKRREQKELFTGKKSGDWFDGSFNNYLTGYDFALDIDDKNNDLMKAYKTAKKIKKLFDDYKLPYSVKSSANKGFHFIISDKWFDKRLKPKNKVILCGKLGQSISDVYNLKNVDNTIFDHRRILKLAYILQDGKVTLPLSDEQFEKFCPEMITAENIFTNPKYFVKFFKRGLLERNYGLDEKSLYKNLQKFVRDYK